MFCPGWILVGICTWISGKRMQTPTYNETTMTKPNGGLNLHPEWGFNWLNAMGDITSMMSENWGDKRMYSHSTNDISWYNQDRAWVMPSRVPRNDTLYYQKWPTTSHGSNHPEALTVVHKWCFQMCPRLSSIRSLLHADPSTVLSPTTQRTVRLPFAVSCKPIWSRLSPHSWW
jgi:hypothetical protein